MAKAWKIPDLNPDEPLGECLGKILRARFAEMVSYEEGTLAGVDIEFLHSMRVSSRRVQAALKIFREAFPHKKFRAEYVQIRTLTRALGEVRNFDVFIEKLEKYKPNLNEKDIKALELLIARQKALRTEKRKTLVKTLNYLNRIDYKKNFETFIESAPET
jgi:CHAD domain-containing protein